MAEQVMREVTLDEWCSKLWPGHRVNIELTRLRSQLAEAETERDRLSAAIMPKGCPKFAEGIDPVVMLDEERKVWRDEIAAISTALAASESKLAMLEAENAALQESDERCEACNRVATKHDDEGVPLCRACWQAMVDESNDGEATEEPR